MKILLTRVFSDIINKKSLVISCFNTNYERFVILKKLITLFIDIFFS
jgi:hypothetical protein